MPEIRTAPVPADQCGDPLACPDLLPAGAVLDTELGLDPAHVGEAHDLFDAFLGPLELPTGRLVCKPGIWLLVDGAGEGRRWLAIDFLVPGTKTRTRSNGELGWDVQLNSELGRAETNPQGREAARDRYVVELDRPLPDWMHPIVADAQQEADRGIA